jgi:hypothetical protein
LVLGRVLGTMLLGVGLGLGLVPMITLGLREGVVVPSADAITLLFAVASIVGAGFAAVTTGLALRFRIERVLIGAFLLSVLMPARYETVIESRLEDIGRWLVATASGEVAFVLPVVAVMVAGAALAIGALLARWAIATATETPVTMDLSGISPIDWRRVRYPAGQRGPARAMLMLQLRLAAERLPQQVALLLGGAVLLPFLPGQLATFAAFYLPMMAAAIPTAVVGRTAAARMSGTIEGFATLPVRREWLVLGSLLATAALSLVAIGGVMLLRFAADRPITLLAAFALWGVVTGGSAVANGMAAWFRPRHLPVVLVVGMFAMAAVVVAMLPIVMAPMAGGAFAAPTLLQVLVGLISLLLVAPLGGALYGRGLERFELVRS